MTNDYYANLRADFVNTYKDELCEESLSLINKADTVEKFINILHLFIWNINVKPLPRHKWVKKWFINHLSLANSQGCYIDQIVSVTNPTCESIVCFGNTSLSLVITKPCSLSISLRDDSTLSICAFPVCLIKVRTTDTSKVNILHKSRHAHIKIKTL